jgi:hypothetical protein
MGLSLAARLPNETDCTTPVGRNLRAIHFYTSQKVQVMQINPPSLGKVTLVYIGYYLAIAVLMNLALWALERFAGFVIEANSVGWMPLIMGAMFAGQFYGKKVGAKPPQSFSWMAGLMFLLTSLMLSLAILYAVAVAMGLDVGATIRELQAGAGEDTALVAGIIGGVLLVIWVALRIMFSTGAAGAVKQAARLAASGK